MLATKALRWFVVAGAFAMMTAIPVHGVMAQEDDSDFKVRHTAIHGSGPVTIAPTACPSPAAAGNECYSITSSAVKGKTTSATLSGTLLVSTTTSQKGKNKVCYTVLGASTETISIDSVAGQITFGPASACITTNPKKMTSSEAVTPAGVWTTATGDPVTGKGKESWKVTPTDPTSPTSPLAGSGTVTFTGSVTP
jgi:hypothetical protein